MRTLVDIGESEIVALDAMALKRQKARAVLIREAISDYLARHRMTDPADAFGLWSSRARDGVAFQEDIRSEW
jgi:predicted transcriptional regulator